jgi:F-type H+-transporting ATPase subunit epsilon
MNDGTFRLEIVTPLHVYAREVRSLRLKDRTGFFGIMRGHCDFLTLLIPSLGYYFDADGREHFLAVDGGIFTVRGGRATLTSREVFESDEAARLAETIDTTVARRDASELAFSQMIEGIERSFIEKSAALGRGRP